MYLSFGQNIASSVAEWFVKLHRTPNLFRHQCTDFQQMQNDAKSSITWWGKGFFEELQNTACLFLRFQGKTVKEGNEPSFKYPATCFPSAIFESGSCPWKYLDKKLAYIDIFISMAWIG